MNKVSPVLSKAPLKSGIFTSSDNSGIKSAVSANIPSMNVKSTSITGANPPPPPPPPLNMCIIINILHYLKPFSKTLILAEPLDNAGSEAERAAFMALRFILNQLNNNNIIINNIINNKNENGKDPEPINIYPFLDKFCTVTNSNFHRFDELDVSFVWDNIIKLICNVVPPLRKIFYGLTECPPNETAPWLSNMSRCLHVQFEAPMQSLEEVITINLSNSIETNIPEGSSSYVAAKNRIKESNSSILSRNPEVLVFIVESSYLPQQLQQLMIQATAESVVANKSAASSSSNGNNPKTIATNSSGPPNSSKNPTAIKFPQSFDLTTFLPKKGQDTLIDNRSYELTSIISLEGQSFETVQAYYRVFDIGEELGIPSDEIDKKNVKWFKGSGPHHEEVEEYKMIERNCFNSCETKSKNRVHPRLLIYVKKDFETIYTRLRPHVTRAGQMKTLADKTFQLAKIPEDYDEARQYYEHSIAFDETGEMKTILLDRMNALDQIERNQRAQCYENQADNSLGKKRYKEACDLYKIAIRSLNNPNSSSSGSNSSNNAFFQRIKEKEELVLKIISLEIANHLSEKGEDCLRSNSYPQAKDQFAQTLKLNPEYIILQLIVSGIEKNITSQTSAQKITEGNQAMKVGKYKLANQLFLEAIALVPEKHDNLKPVLDGLVILMQGEDALIKQRTGLLALEDKKYSLAISLISEAIEILPPDSVTEHAYFLCDRALVYFEMKDYETAIKDCREALCLKADLAIAFLRLGSAQFELELYDDATLSYEKAIKNDPSLSEQVKVKVRQVNTAKEVLKRKEREAERARLKEEEKRLLEEKKARDEQLKKERQEKLAQEQLEKAERTRLKEEERLTKALLEKEQMVSKEKNKEAEKERLKLEKAERDAQRAAERERARAEKERERERVRLEKEQKILLDRKAQAEELQKQREFSAELERAEARLKEAEREKELEKEKARLERERLIAEREKARSDKLLSEGSKKNKTSEVKQITTSATVADNAVVQTSAQISLAPSKPTLTSTTSVTVSAVAATVPAKVSTSKSWSQPLSNIDMKAKPIVSVPTTKWSSILALSDSSDDNRTSINRTNDFPSLSEVIQGPTNQNTSTKSLKSDEKLNPVDADYMTPKISSAWADHQRALLEASADSLSTSITVPKVVSSPIATDKKEPLVDYEVPVSQSYSVKVPTPSPIVSNLESDNISPLLSKLRYGGGLEPQVIASKPLKDQSNYSLNLTQPIDSKQNSLFGAASETRDFTSFHLPQQQPTVPSLVAENDVSVADNSLALNTNQFYGSISDRINPDIVDTSIDSFMNFDSYSDLLDGDLNFSVNSFDETARSQGIMSSDSINSTGYSVNDLSTLGGLGSSQFGTTNLSLGSTFINQAPPSKQLHTADLNGNYLSKSTINFDLETDYFNSGKQYTPGLESLRDFEYSNDISSFLLDDVIGPSSSNLTSNYSTSGIISSNSNPFNTGPSTLLSTSAKFSSSSINQHESLKFNDLLGSNESNRLHQLGSSSSGSFAFSQPNNPKGLNDYLNPSPFPIGSDLNLVRPVPQQSHSSSGLMSSPFDSPNIPPSVINPQTAFYSSSGFQNNTTPDPSIINPQKKVGSFLNAIGTNRVTTASPGVLLSSFTPPPVAQSKQQSEGIDSDILPESAFISVAWLRQYNMHMYRWAGDNKEWTEYAMHIPLEMYNVFLGTDPIIKIADLSRSSRCEMWVDEEILGGKKEKFLVFFRGSSGLPSNQAMMTALELVSGKMKSILNHSSEIIHPTSNISVANIANSTAPKLTNPLTLSLGEDLKPNVWNNNNNIIQIVSPTSSIATKGFLDEVSFDQSSLSELLEKELSLSKFPKRDRPELLKIGMMSGTGYVQRSLEIPREVVGLIIGQAGKKIRELCNESGAKIQFRVNKTAEREGRPGLLEVHGSMENVDKGLHLIWDLLQMLGKEYVEVPFQAVSPRVK